ncbi:hypothetical protein ACFQ08_26875, partial [Streptosporangium algeriense]
PARAEAERIDLAWAEWTVLYSLGKRCFYAMAAWDGPRPVVVEDSTSEGLEERMREAETIRAMWLAAPVSRSFSAPVRGGASRRRGGAVAEAPGEESASAGGRRSPGGRAA